MSCLPPTGTAAGTRHLLDAKGVEPKEYEWTGKGWSTPGTGYHSKPAIMAVLGWRYLRPAPRAIVEPKP